MPVLFVYTQLPVGRESINQYRSHCRIPVFSHDELVCKMMAQSERLEVCLLLSTCKDSAYMIDLEEQSLSTLASKVCVCVMSKEMLSVYNLALEYRCVLQAV